ncbi:MAG: hypothetical protein PHX57_01045 [Desulfobulbaceae bacterium]|jgi:hypothetical protein|nr:hypothetical protein [Desulfobulbaceae bacterium]
MSGPLRIIILVVGGFITLLVLVSSALFLFVDEEACKSRIETAASEGLGMEVGVDGRLREDSISSMTASMR